ncbi:MAG: type II toxin-antitoxin system PemK/MazF family toxin [Armatimonadetes bacterium]|nr:type II toxin-antitoxin system PemK/MazF family toxin [Armatimonadota bacterium]
MVRGEVYFVRLRPRSGSEQSGTRPCVLVSRDNFNRSESWMSVTVVPVTSSERWRRPSPVTVLLRAGEAGLAAESAAMAHQVTTVDRSKFLLPAVGRLSPDRMAEVDQALRNYLDLA